MIELDPETIVPRRTFADFVHELGDIALDRIRMVPSPGTATIADVENAKGCELIEGALVEKAMGMRESLLAVYIASLIRPFVASRNLGIVLGADGTMEILTGLVRLPDVAFVSWDRMPHRVIPEEPVPALAPDLAIEVLSRGNTPREMARKRREYFTAGVRRVWMVDRFNRTVSVYSSEPNSARSLIQTRSMAKTFSPDSSFPSAIFLVNLSVTAKIREKNCQVVYTNEQQNEP